jgi:hypothetical protein
MDGRDYAGNGTPGELRFVFGAFNKTANPADPPPINATVILEYHFPPIHQPFIWASMFKKLGKLDFGDPQFLSQLDTITSRVVEPNVWMTKPNTSAIAQIRTNENAFDGAAVSSNRKWEFRQFALLPCSSGVCQLAQVPVSQTPPTSKNKTLELTDFLSNKQNLISTGAHVVDPALLGGSSLTLPGNMPGNNAVLWNTVTDPNTGFSVLVNPSEHQFSYQVRHQFAFGTCNGCHYLETENTLAFFHIKPRFANSPSTLSQFLSTALTDDVAPMGETEAIFSFQDPNPESEDQGDARPLFKYNEIWRRACELTRVRSGNSTPLTTPTGHSF